MYISYPLLWVWVRNSESLCSTSTLIAPSELMYSWVEGEEWRVTNIAKLKFASCDKNKSFVFVSRKIKLWGSDVKYHKFKSKSRSFIQILLWGWSIPIKNGRYCTNLLDKLSINFILYSSLFWGRGILYINIINNFNFCH